MATKEMRPLVFVEVHDRAAGANDDRSTEEESQDLSPEPGDSDEVEVGEAGSERHWVIFLVKREGLLSPSLCLLLSCFLIAECLDDIIGGRAASLWTDGSTSNWVYL